MRGFWQKRRYAYYFLTVLFIAGSLPGCKKAEPQIDDRSPIVSMPVLVNDVPVIGIYIEDYGLHQWNDPNETFGPKAILLVWADGRVVWSKDNLSGGPPYLTGAISTEEIGKFFQALNERGVFDTKVRQRGCYGPDSEFTHIAIVNGPKYVNMSSWHEQFETEPNLVATHTGIEGLDGRRREDVIANQPADYKEFCRIWSVIREEAKKLIPAEGKLAENLHFEIKQVDVK